MIKLWPYVSYEDPNLSQKIVKEIRKNGMVVVSDVFNHQECDQLMDGLVDNLCKFGSGIEEDKIPETWTRDRLPPQSAPGMFQSLVSNFPEIWSIRTNNRVRRIFEILYSAVRERQITDFIVSGDGMNLKPNMGPLHFDGATDWPHVDQTTRENIYECIQGQVVLTNTTAAFRCSPKSHTVYPEILDKLNVNPEDESNWLLLNEGKEEVARDCVKRIGGSWQEPIYTKKGSMIFWFSSTIHSAKQQNKIEPISSVDRYLGWRGVVYVCYRPREEFSEDNLALRKKAFEMNRTTNHWATAIFPKVTGGPSQKTIKFHEAIVNLLVDPEKVYDIIPKPVETDEINQLL